MNPSMGRISPKGKIEIKVVSLDELTSRGEIQPPNYMKIDVEGAELSVLLGAMATLRKYLPTVLLATHGRSVHEQCSQLLSSLDYRIEVLADNHKADDHMRVELLARPTQERFQFESARC